MARARARKSVAIGKSVAVDKPLLRLSLSTMRMRGLMLIIGAGFVVLTGGAVYAHLGQPDSVAKTASKSTSRTISTKAARGKILDRNGRVLASSLPASSISVDPGVFAQANASQVKAFAKTLNMSTAQLRARIKRGSRLYANLARNVEMARVTKIREMRLPGLQIEPEFKRHYPEGASAAQLIGITNRDDKGQEGIELQTDEMLRGREGFRKVALDRAGRRIGSISEVRAPVPGTDVRLSIDSRLQFQAFAALQEAVKEHQAKAAGVIVLDVITGEVLAISNWPSFDPNDRRKFSAPAMRNRAIIDRFEPGSTMKPFTVALALELRKVTPLTLIDTDKGHITIGPDTIRDAHPVGVVTVEQVIQKSSNVATTKIALDMEAEQLWAFFSAVGIGQPPRISFPGATAGSLRPYRKWRPVEQATMAYGYGLSASLLQLARAYMIFARDGDLPEISLFRREEAAPGRQIISTRTARQVRKMMEMAAGPNGTARKSAVVGYRVAGKTGTSRKLLKGKYVKEYASTFVGMVPASAPRLIVATFIDEPKGDKFYAGDVAAPLFSKVAGHALRQLRIAPDAPVAEIEVPDQTDVDTKASSGRKRS